MGRKPLAGLFLTIGVSVGTAALAVPTADDPAQLLERAEGVRTSNHSEFVSILKRLDQQAAGLSLEQQWHLRYLDAWQMAFDGNYSKAGAALKAIEDQSPYAPLRLRATATQLNILGFGHRYEVGFAQLDRLANLLTQVNDKEARFYAQGEAAQFLIIAGQYDLASDYAEQMFENIPTGRSACKATYMKLHALFHGGANRVQQQEFQQGIDTCTHGGESLFANALRSDLADLDIQLGQAANAIELLQGHYAEVEGYHYPALMEFFNILLAKGYLKQGDLDKTRKFALATIANGVENEYSEPLSQAYDLLYRLETQQGNMRAALTYHEKFMAADKGYLNDVSARALAYQTVKQQLLANKLQVDTLNKQNKILQLQRELDHKAVENGRLYIALLLMFLASIALWLYRLKRSQLRFKRLAQQDSLTGIYSRQHFVDAAELALRQAAKSTRSACLILMDLDHFKLVNDTYGHGIGDAVLKRTVTACQGHLLSHDVFGRLGGEEFAILLPECGPAQARDRAERIRMAIAATPVDGETRDVVISASFGVASTDRSGYELRQLMIDADNALYRAKHDGRNRVVYGELGDVSTGPGADTGGHGVNGDLHPMPPHTGAVS
ncbi:GGDEF domain-containing protein [Dyella sp. Tek66A03]|uniref:GGDEF domain-containing protein n=1 Tax=Dyella sp. Tek66A03 TaxID=3458298 RepID=UPI00403E9EFD